MKKPRQLGNNELIEQPIINTELISNSPITEIGIHEESKRKLVEVEVLESSILDTAILGDSIINTDVENAIAPGIRGTTFIPDISTEGIISWTNDGNLPNPDPKYIIGPQGPQGPEGPPGPAGGPPGPPGPPTIVNGKTGESIILTAADVGALSSEDFNLIDCGTSLEVI